MQVVEMTVKPVHEDCGPNEGSEARHGNVAETLQKTSSWDPGRTGVGNRCRQRGGNYTILYYTILYYTILYYNILYYTILYYTILYYTILYYTITVHHRCHRFS